MSHLKISTRLGLLIGLLAFYGLERIALWRHAIDSDQLQLDRRGCELL